MPDAGTGPASPTVLVVHCIDTEGPLGGDIRRNPDGTAEFMDNWDDIAASLEELTEPGFRQTHLDSQLNPYTYNWFILDFTGFKTNPKKRIPIYNDTYDQIKRLNTSMDGFYWHYHVPPADGAGDQWSDTWLSSNECNRILAHRLLDRFDFPAVFRAGGTIEDEPGSQWLEEVFPLDFSNRISKRSYAGADLFNFNWYGAPDEWGSYHPSHDDFTKPGQMRRFIYRCIDLRSRSNDLTSTDVDNCFAAVSETGHTAVLSFFSHDVRDMRPETYDIYDALTAAAENHNVPWLSCTATQAHQLYHGISPRLTSLDVSVAAGAVRIVTDGSAFQSTPFVAARLVDDRAVRLYPESVSATEWLLPLDVSRLRRIGVAVTSESGDKSVYVGDISQLGGAFVLTPCVETASGQEAVGREPRPAMRSVR